MLLSMLSLVHKTIFGTTCLYSVIIIEVKKHRGPSRLIYPFNFVWMASQLRLVTRACLVDQ